MRTFYRLSYLIIQVILRFAFRLSVKGREHIPLKGPFIAASNHVAYLDPVFIGAVLKREIYYLARAELFDQPVLRIFIKKLNAIPIRRGYSDLKSLKRCLAVLSHEHKPVLMFPEGTRIRTGRLGHPHRGISLLAARTRVPILPIYIENSDRIIDCLLGKRRLIIRIGESISYPEYRHLLADREHYLEFALLVMSKIDLVKTGLRRTQLNV